MIAAPASILQVDSSLGNIIGFAICIGSNVCKHIHITCVYSRNRSLFLMLSRIPLPLLSFSSLFFSFPFLYVSWYWSSLTILPANVKVHLKWIFMRMKSFTLYNVIYKCLIKDIKINYKITNFYYLIKNFFLWRAHVLFCSQTFVLKIDNNENNKKYRDTVKKNGYILSN